MVRSLILGMIFGHMANVERNTLECRCCAFSFVARYHMRFMSFLLQYMLSFINPVLSFIPFFEHLAKHRRTQVPHPSDQSVLHSCTVRFITFISTPFPATAILHKQ